MKRVLKLGAGDSIILFLHGYGASAGFWIPHLPVFKGYQLWVPHIIYAPPYTESSFDGLAGSLLKEVVCPQVCIAHSLGSHLAASICRSVKMKNFLIAPSILFESFNAANSIFFFGDNNDGMPDSLQAIRPSHDNAKFFTESNIYIPTDDQIAKYRTFKNGHVHSYIGDHFQIGSAIEAISRDLNG